MWPQAAWKREYGLPKILLFSSWPVSYTPGLGLGPDRFKGGTRDVEHRNGTCVLRRPEEVENKR